jgi:hypothetical protein
MKMYLHLSCYTPADYFSWLQCPRMRKNNYFRYIRKSIANPLKLTQLVNQRV